MVLVSLLSGKKTTSYVVTLKTKKNMILTEIRQCRTTIIEQVINMGLKCYQTLQRQNF